jgi:hypothetical protein
MRDHDERRALALVDVKHDLPQFFARFLVEVAGRFVGQHNLGLHDHRPRERHALLLAAADLAGLVIKPLAQAQFFQRTRAIRAA